MRIVRTDYFYDKSEFSIPPRAGREVAGFSALWFRTKTNDLIDLNRCVRKGKPEHSATPGLYQSEVLNVDGVHREASVEHLIGNFIDESLSGFAAGSVGRIRRALHDVTLARTYPEVMAGRSAHYLNPGLVEQILNDGIIIERSPPENVPFWQLLAGKSYIAIGSYIGFPGATSSPFMMVLSTAGGIVVMGAAYGIANGLQRGLSRVIAEWIEKAMPTSHAIEQPKRPPRKANRKTTHKDK